LWRLREEGDWWFNHGNTKQGEARKGIRIQTERIAKAQNEKKRGEGYELRFANTKI